MLRPILPPLMVSVSVLLIGCQTSVHPRVGLGMPNPKWVEYEKKPLVVDDGGQVRSTERISARHILVAYQGSAQADPSIHRTRDEAFLRANEVRQKALAGDDFAELAAQFSDEPGAAERGGDLGTFGPHQMVKNFSDAAFALKPGEISQVVETKFGFHVIQRTPSSTDSAVAAPPAH